MGYVYAIESNRGSVKIGWSGNPLRRMETLLREDPGELRIIGSVPGTKMDERAIHARLAKYRLRGDWFRMEGEVVKYVKSMPIIIPENLAARVVKGRDENGWDVVFDVFGGPAYLGRALGCSKQTALGIINRGFIPAVYWHKIVKGAEERGRLDINYEFLGRLAADFPSQAYLKTQKSTRP